MMQEFNEDDYRKAKIFTSRGVQATGQFALSKQISEVNKPSTDVLSQEVQTNGMCYP